MTAWVDAIPAFAVTALLLFVPGGLVVTILGARRLTAFALAAPVSLGIIGAAAIALHLVGVGFTPLTVGVVTLVAAAIALALRLWWRRPFLRLGALAGSGPVEKPAAAPAWNIAALVAAVALPALVIGTRYLTAIGGPDRVSQTFDNIFHLNAVALIAGTGNGSSLVLGNLTEASSGFYPASFNDAAALVSQAVGVGAATGITTVSVIMAAVVWPLSCLFLAVRLFGNQPTPLVLTGVLSAAFGAFPYHLLSYGAVFPFHAGVAMMPLLLGLTIEALGRSHARISSVGAAVTALVLVLPGFVLTHPSIVVATLVFGAPFALAALIVAIRERRTLSRPRLVLRIGIPGAYAAVTLLAVLKARPTLEDAPWFAFESHSTAIGSVLGSAPLALPTAWALFALTLVGLATAVRRIRRYWPILGTYAIAALMYVVASSWATGRFRDLVVGVWYRDSHRIAALLVVAALPIAVLGAVAVVRLIRDALLRFVRTRTPRTAANVLVATALVVAIVLLPLTQRGQIGIVQGEIASVYATGNAAALLSDDERALLAEIDDFVPAEDTIVGNPATGTAFALALADRSVLLPHVFGARSADEVYLLNHWDEAATDPAVCPLIRERHAYWALDFGTRWPHGDNSVMPGTDAVTTAPGIEEVARVGDAALYRVTACG